MYRAVSEDGDELYLKVKRSGSELTGLYFFILKDGSMEEPMSGNVVGTVQGDDIEVDLRNPYDPEESIADASGEFRPNGDIFFQLPDDPSTEENEAEEVLFQPVIEPSRGRRNGDLSTHAILLGTEDANYSYKIYADGAGSPILNTGGLTLAEKRTVHHVTGWTFLLGQWRCVHLHSTRTVGDLQLFEHIGTYWLKADYTDVQNKYLGKDVPLHKDSEVKINGTWRKLSNSIDGNGFYTNRFWKFRNWRD